MLLVPVAFTTADVATIGTHIRREPSVMDTGEVPSRVLVALLGRNGLDTAFELGLTDLVTVHFVTDADPCMCYQTGLRVRPLDDDKVIIGGTLTDIIMAMTRHGSELLTGIYQYLCNRDPGCSTILQSFKRIKQPDGTFRLCMKASHGRY